MEDSLKNLRFRKFEKSRDLGKLRELALDGSFYPSDEETTDVAVSNMTSILMNAEKKGIDVVAENSDGEVVAFALAGFHHRPLHHHRPEVRVVYAPRHLLQNHEFVHAVRHGAREYMRHLYS